jgi:surface antigen
MKKHAVEKMARYSVTEKKSCRKAVHGILRGGRDGTAAGFLAAWREKK